MKSVTFKISFLFPAVLFLFAGIFRSPGKAMAIAADSIPQQKEKSFHKPLLTGNFFTQFRKGFNDRNDKNRASAYFDYGFSPILLWKISKRFFIESELEAKSLRGKAHIKVGYADVNFIAAKFLTLQAGNFLSPLGTYQERLHPMWINKLPEVPMGFGHDDLLPVTETGANIRGGFSVLKSKLNYCFFVSNGPILSDGHHLKRTEGMLLYSDEDTSMLGFLNLKKNYKDNNSNKATGGRIGILPFPNSSFEIGVWGETAVVGDRFKAHVHTFPAGTPHIDEPDYSNVQSRIYGFDFSCLKKVSFLKGMIDIKGQWNEIKTGYSKYLNTYDTSGVVWSYAFANHSIDYYAQCAYHLSFFENNILNKSEFCFRYSYIKTPKGSLWEKEIKQYTIGYNYWINWHSVLKLAFQMENGTQARQVVLLQWAMGF